MPEVTALERAGQATQGLLGGDLDSTWRSMLSPQTLTPEQRDAFLKKVGVKDTIYESVFQGLTNPLLIVSLILSHKFPVPIGDEVLKLSKKVSGYASRLPLLGRWMSKDAWFRGTAVPEYLDEAAYHVMDFKKRYGIEYGNVLKQFQEKTGRLPSSKEQILVGAWLDGLHNPLKGFKGKNGKIRLGSGSTQLTMDEVGTLFPDLERRMGPELVGLAKNMRKVLDTTWDEVFGNLQNRKQILKALRKQRNAGFWDDTSEVMLQFIQNPRKIKDYFPHRVLQTPEDFQRMVQTMIQSGDRAYGRAAAKKAASWASPEVMKRQFSMLPSWQDLEKVADFVDPQALERLRAVAKGKVLHAARQAGVRENIVQKLGALDYGDIVNNYTKYLGEAEAKLVAGAIADHAPRQYSIAAMPVLSSYTHTLAGTFGWTVKGYGEKLTDELASIKALAAAGNKYAASRADVLENTLIPLAMGRQTFDKALKAQAWQQGMTELAAKMEAPAFQQLVGKGIAKSLSEHVKNSRGAFNLMGLTQKTSAYFYLSTLGLNPGSAIRNQLQNVLTLGPVLGWRTAAQGMSEAMRKSHKYFALRFGPRAMSHEEALAKAYPEFAKAGLNAGKITDEVVEQSLRAAYDLGHVPSKAATVAEKISRGMMSMFTASETLNRVSAFEAGMLHARRAGLNPDAAISFARQIVQKTQFVMTPTSGPIAMAGWNSLAKQFTYFPSKMLEFATSTAVTLGSGAIDPRTGREQNIMGYNPGTLARAVAGSIIAMELGDTFGVDLRSSLLGSALPTLQTPREGSPFGALPIVPPGLQVAGSAAYGLSTGEWDSMKYSLPLLVPGGVAVSKVAGFVPPSVGTTMGQDIARTLDRPYADYSQPSPDGRYAVYSGKGTFRGYYTAWDLLKTGLGIRGGDLDKEQEVLALVTKNREQISQAKRDYMDAHFRNSAREATAIAHQFRQRFGFQLPVSEKDMKAMQLRRTTTRLEQLIRTTPAGPAREQMIQQVSAALGASATELLGVDPALLGQARPAAEKSRFGGGRTAASSLPRFDAADLGPTEEVNPRTIGRQRGVTNLQPLP